MYYHLFCLQNQELMETGKNSKTLKELKEGLLSYISLDHDETSMKSFKKMKPRELADFFEFSIPTTNNKI